VSSAKKKPLTFALARLSEILGDIDELVCEFDDLYGQAGIRGAIGNEVYEFLTDAVCDARSMIGDDMPDGEWLVAVRNPSTRAEYYAEVKARIERGLRREQKERRERERRAS
jgi:hypothetical protein